MKKLAQEDSEKESSQLANIRQEPLRDEVLELLFGSSYKKVDSVDKTVEEPSLEELLESGGGSVDEECQNETATELADAVPDSNALEETDSHESRSDKLGDVDGVGEDKPTEVSVSQTQSVEAVGKSQQSEFWQQCLELSRGQQWEEINALSACPSGIDSHEAKYWWIYSQYQLKEFPVAILIAPLQHLLEGHLEAGLKNIPVPENAYEFGIRALAHELVKAALHEGVSLVQVYPLLASIRQLFGEEYAFVSEEDSVVELLQNKPEYERTSLEKNILDELQELSERRLGGEQQSFDAKAVTSEQHHISQVVPQTPAQASEQLEAAHQASVAQRKRSGRGGTRSMLLFLLEGVVCAGALIGLFFFFEDTVFQGRSRSEEATIAFTSEFSVSAPELVLPAEEEVAPRLFRGMLLDAEQRSNAETPGLSTASYGNQEEKVSNGTPRLAHGSDTIDMTGPLEPEGLMQEIREKQQSGAVVSDEFVRDVGKDLFGAKNEEVRQTESVSPPTTIPYRVIEEAAVRKEASEDADVIEYLRAGTKVHVLKRVGDWLVLVSRNGNMAFLKRSQATLIEPKESQPPP